MKSIFKVGFLALALIVASCAELENPQTPEEPGTETPEAPTPDNPDTPATPEDPNVVVFTANVDVKTAIDSDDKEVTWVAGDQVKFIWNGGEAVAAAETSGAATTFKVRLEDGIDEVYAVYPAALGATFVDGELVLDFSNQLEGGEFSKADVSVSRAAKENGVWNTVLNFKNAVCLFKLEITTSDIARIQIKTIADEAIAGRVPVGFDTEGNITLGEPTDGNATVNMTINGPGNYYIPVLAGVEIADGFRINRFDADSEHVGTPFYYMAPFTTERGQIVRLSQFETRCGQYYVTPEGTGNKAGHTWENAIDVETFKEFVTNQDNHFLLKGSTFHFSADEFSFGDDYLYLKYENHSNVNFTLQGTATQTDTTVFLGRTNTTESNKAGVIGVQNNCLLTVKNVKFTGTHGMSNSAVFRLNSGAKELNLINCQFRGNSTPKGNGPTIAVFNGATVNVEGCSFSDNDGYGFLARVDGSGAILNIKDTEVKNNTGNGLYSTKLGSLTLERVRFLNNHAVEDSGAAAFIEGTDGEILFKDCEFIGNKADYRGGAICVSGVADVTIKGGKFDGNSANGQGSSTEASSGAGGAAIQIQAAATVDISDVQFLNNYCNSGTNLRMHGVIYACADGAVVRCNNCLFDANCSSRSTGDNESCPAISKINHKVSLYFNACEFKRNSSGGYVGNGSKYGMLFGVRSSGVLALNNCYMHDNYGVRNTDPIDWIHIDNDNATLFLSNNTIIGDPTRYGYTSPKNTNGVLYLNKDAYYRFINNILCSPTVGGKCIQGGTSYSAGFAMYNKTSPTTGFGWGDSDTGSGHDYYATADSFGGLNGYLWNGTMTGTNSDVLAPTADVNAAIQEKLPEFHSWLDEIGALGKDMLGNDRGATSWPGCYQN